jgi:hypothetical protein
MSAVSWVAEQRYPARFLRHRLAILFLIGWAGGTVSSLVRVFWGRAPKSNISIVMRRGDGRLSREDTSNRSEVRDLRGCAIGFQGVLLQFEAYFR